MAISTVTNRREYQGDGSSAIFAWQFPLHAQSDLAVFAFNSSATTPGIVNALALNGGGAYGYTISGNADPSGVYQNGVNIVVNSAPNAQTVIVAFRSSVLTSTFRVGQSGAIPSSALNNALDYLTLLAQRAQDLNTRSAKLHDGWVGTFDPSLPKNFVANATLAFNSSANGFAVGPTIDQILAVQSSAILTNSAVVSATNQAILAGQQAVLAGSAALSAFNQVGLAAAQVVLANSAALSASNSVAAFPPMPFTQHAIVYASSATQLALVPSATAGLPLIAQGSSAPTFGLSFSAPTVVTGAYNALTSDETIIANSTNYNVNLFNSAQNAGRRLRIKRGSTTNSSYVTILGTSAQTIDGVSSIQLFADGDYLDLLADGSNWRLMNDRITNRVHYHQANGYGSTNTVIRRFLNQPELVGNVLTATNTAGSGVTITILLPGRYSFSYTDLFSSADDLGLTLNSNELTTAITSVAAANVLAIAATHAADQPSNCSWTGVLKAGDIVRPHARAAGSSTVDGRAHLWVTRL